VLGLDLAERPLHHLLVHVQAAQARVAARPDHLDVVRGDVDDGHVERPAAQVVHRVHLILAGLQAALDAVGDGRRGGFVDHSMDVEAGDAPRVVGGRVLNRIEVRRHRDHRVVHRFAQVVLRAQFQVAQDERRDGLGIVGLAPHGHLEVPPHLPLDLGDGVVRVAQEILLGVLAGDHFARVVQTHDGRRRVRPPQVRDDHGLLPLLVPHRHRRVRRPQVNPHDLGHTVSPLSDLGWKRHSFTITCGARNTRP